MIDLLQENRCLRHQPQVNKCRFKTQKKTTKITTHLSSLMCVCLRCGSSGLMLEGQREHGRKKKLRIKTAPGAETTRFTSQPRRNRWWKWLFNWRMHAGNAYFRLAADRIAVRRAIMPRLLSPLLPADRFGERWMRSATATANTRQKRSHVGLPGKSFKVKVEF